MREKGSQRRRKESSSGDDIGIIDPTSFLTFLSALITVLFFLSTFIGLAGIVLLLINQEQKLYAIGPGITLLMALLYVLFAFPKRCCVCHQKQFTKAHNRTKGKSHYIPLLGYVVPTSFRILFFRNFYCIVCSSKLRLFK